MADSLTDRVGGVLSDVRTRHLLTMKLDVRPMLVVGQTAAAFRRVGVVYGGRFEGERLAGDILDGGSDWQSVRRDGSVLLDVRLTLKAADGALIGMTYRGIRQGPPAIIAQIDRGEEVDPASYYFRINPLFETASPGYAWLNDVVAIGLGHRFKDGPVYNVFEVL